MLLLLMGYGAAAPVVADAAGLAYLEESRIYGAFLEEAIYHTASKDEAQIYGAHTTEER